MAAEQREVYSPWILENVVSDQSIRLQFGVNTVGKHPESYIWIEFSKFVSRHHATIEIRNDGAVHVSDLGSTNGTYINIEIPLMQYGRVRRQPRAYISFGCRHPCIHCEVMYVLVYQPIECQPVIIRQLNNDDEFSDDEYSDFGDLDSSYSDSYCSDPVGFACDDNLSVMSSDDLNFNYDATASEDSDASNSDISFDSCICGNDDFYIFNLSFN